MLASILTPKYSVSASNRPPEAILSPSSSCRNSLPSTAATTGSGPRRRRSVGGVSASSYDTGLSSPLLKLRDTSVFRLSVNECTVALLTPSGNVLLVEEEGVVGRRRNANKTNNHKDKTKSSSMNIIINDTNSNNHCKPISVASTDEMIMDSLPTNTPENTLCQYVQLAVLEVSSSSLLMMMQKQGGGGEKEAITEVTAVAEWDGVDLRNSVHLNAMTSSLCTRYFI
jgi:hypothetical protein